MPRCEKCNAEIDEHDLTCSCPEQYEYEAEPYEYEDLGDCSIPAADEANIPVNVWLRMGKRGEDEDENAGYWVLEASNYMPRKAAVVGDAYKARSKDRQVLVDLVREHWVPLYEAATEVLKEMAPDDELGDGDFCLYYWKRSPSSLRRSPEERVEVVVGKIAKYRELEKRLYYHEREELARLRALRDHVVALRELEDIRMTCEACLDNEFGECALHAADLTDHEDALRVVVEECRKAAR